MCVKVRFSISLNSFTLSVESHTIKMCPDDDYHYYLLFIYIWFAIYAGVASVSIPDTYRTSLNKQKRPVFETKICL